MSVRLVKWCWVINLTRKQLAEHHEISSDRMTQWICLLKLPEDTQRQIHALGDSWDQIAYHKDGSKQVIYNGVCSQAWRETERIWVFDRKERLKRNQLSLNGH